jgi:hypothetical protein
MLQLRRVKCEPLRRPSVAAFLFIWRKIIMAHDRPIVGNYLDLQVFRAAAILPAAGAYDAAPLALDCPEFNFLTLFLTYTAGAAGGSVRFYVEVSPDSAGATWFRATLYQGGVLAAGVDVSSNLQRETHLYTAVGVGAEPVVFGPLVLQSGIQRIRIPCAEVGVILAPGNAALRGFFSN